MPKEPPFKKKPAKGGSSFGRRKKLGYRTPNRFRRLISRKKPDVTIRPRSLGGHR